ncbi:UNVERIFIED_CONTAM: Cannabidiolic acid synthase [Sesamum calycinum]|uniref:Cannabidiolic acid synthase n=1 Tax=Sesamum calycinum TaxID=2727403 RepID=A0AAW2JJY8_9LAMI
MTKNGWTAVYGEKQWWASDEGVWWSWGGRILMGVVHFAMQRWDGGGSGASADGNVDGFLECLKEEFHNYNSISSLVYTPINSSFLSVLNFSIRNMRFSLDSTPKPQVIITPKHEYQIPSIIYCAKENQLQIRTRSGGHDFEGRSYVTDVPFVICSILVTVDAEQKTAWWRRLRHIAPKYGLAADNVIDARIVDVNGRILTRKSMGEDLFWAIREDSAWCKILQRKSDYVQKPIPISGFEGIWRLFYESEGREAEILLTPYGGRMAEIPESAIPFPHRAGNLYKLHHMVYWKAEDAQNADKYINWIRRLYSYVAPYVSKSPRGAFLCYRDLDIGVNNNEGVVSIATARVWGTKYFKNNFERLVRVKTKVDPEHFFREEQSIPPRLRWTGRDDI